ncbi:MAG TPA: hypothetical protein VNX21_06120 [Candidatus Thermoplasmatota archaeon]|nr:hypothetical protein [Candidatus Thermoplasmatota archaeon]
MASVNVQFRADPAVVEFVKGLGLKPGEVARAGFEKEVRRLRARAHARDLEALRVKLPKGFAPKAVRDARDAR